MSIQDLRGRKSTLLQRYQRNAESQDPLNQPMSTAPMPKSTSQRSLQNSTLLQRRYSKTNPQDLPAETPAPNPQPSKTSSQRSLDHSKLLQRYTKQNSLDSQDVPKVEPQQYSSHKNLENSKLLQRYGPQTNHSQEFTGLAPRESTPVARFQRSGSLEPERMVRPSLLSRYTPRFGKSLDRNKAVVAGEYSNYSSQQSLDQNVTQSQTFADYGSDHYDQYDSRNLRSRSSSMARGLNSRSMQRELGPSASMNYELEKENVPMEPITPETLPVVATTEPVMGNISSALPMPMLGLIPPTPMVETSKPTLEIDANKLQPKAPSPIPAPQQPQLIVTAEPEKPKRIEPVKPPRKDLVAASAIVSIPIPTITTTIAKIDPPKALIPTTKLEAPVVPKDPSPPLFSVRDRMEHYGSALIPSQSSPKAHPPKQKPQQLAPTPASTAQPKSTNLMTPISDLSSRRSMTDLRQSKQQDGSTFALDIDEASDRNDLRVIAKQKEPVKNTLASAFEQIAVLSVPQVSDAFEDRENIEALPADRKLKKRDHTYHPSFVPKQAKLEEEDRKKQEEKAKQEAHRQEQERRKEEAKLKKENVRLHKESEKSMKEEEKRMKEEEKRLKAEDDKRRKDEEKLAKEQEKRLKEDEKRKKEEEKRKLKEEKKKSTQQAKPTDQEPVVPAEEESVDLGSHLDQYSISGPAKPRSQSATARPRSSGTPRGSQGALNRVSSRMYGSQQSLDRSSGMHSKMLQRYAKRSGSQDFTHHDDMQQFGKDVHRSQGSLEPRVSRSTLLQRYTPKPLSASTAAGQAPAPPSTPRSTSQVSLDKNRIDKSSLLQRYKPKGGSADQPEVDQRMGAVVFQPKKVPGKHASFDYRDHEYEPIGEPVDSKPTGASTLAPPSTGSQRKLSSASLRVPGDDADTISMNELQKDIEDRYFNRPAEEEPLEVVAEISAEATQEKTSKMKAVMASGKKAMARAQESSKSAMAKAQEGGKSLHQKLRKQTDKFKTKINIKKDKEGAPLASPEIVTTPEIEKLDFTIAEPKPDDQETDEVQPVLTVTFEDTNQAEQEETTAETGTAKKRFKTPEFSKLKNIHMPKLQKPEFKRPEFTKISKPKMPKLKTPDMSKFKRPEMPKFLTEKPDFSKLKMPEKIGTIKLQRSKSMKEPSDAASAASPSDASVVGGEDAKKKISYTDFSTYPRLLDKFKRQKSPPGNASVRASTPPPLEFTKAGKTTRPKGKTFISRWAEKSSEGAGSSLFFTGSELGERESSVEKRMRQRLERADFDAPELPVTAEQKQLDEYDKENREIHLVSAARHDEFMKRKPPMERQESDLASEEEKQFWASSLGQKIRQNIDMNSNDFDFLDEDERLRVARENEAMGLSERDRARFLGETLEHPEDYELRSSTPYSNKECQSSTGSSGIRRRKGVLEEIDDDEFFLRQKGISKDNIQMGEYISSAIKEGLSTPVNALAEMGRYDSYDQDMDASERISMEYRGEQNFTDEFRRNADFFKTFPPDRPTRKHKKSYNEEHFDDDEEQNVPYDSYPQEEEEVEFYDRDRKYASEEPRHLGDHDDRYIDEESIGNGFSRTGAAVPPTPPRRRKKRFRDVTPSELEPFANGLTSKPIYNSYTLGPETHLFNAEVPLAREESFTTPLPTPRRSRSRSQISKAFDDDRTSRGAESYIFGAVDSAMMKHSMDRSESNGYATVRKDPPPRPPAPIRRRRSTRSLGDPHQFSTLPNFHSVSPQRPSRNYSTINPNRPPRMKSNTNLDDGAMRSASVSKNDFTEYEDIEQMELQARMHQALETGSVLNKMKDRPLPPPPRPPRDHKKPKKPSHDARHDFDGGAERIVVIHPFERVEEVEIAIQTDPLPEDYELDIEVEETFGGVDEEEPTKTLQEILKEEQRAEIARARQLAEASSLMRDIQKFRDSTSSLSQQGSRPETPAASILERRVSVPTASSMRREVRPLSNENLSEQDLANAEDDKYIAELVKKYVSEEKVSPTESAKRQPKATPAPQPAREIDAEKLREIEAMIVNEQVEREEFRTVQSEPAAPPRRRSLVASSQDLSRSVEISTDVIEEIVERLRTNEQQHIAELQQLQQQQMEDLKKQHEEQQRLHDQKLEEQQKQLMDQQSQQLQETQQLKEQIQQQQEQQKALLLQLQQQEKEREHVREVAQQRAKELEQQRMLELQQQQLILLQQEKEREHARELEQQLAKELEQQRIRETQRIHELEMQRAREAELLRAKEAELLRAKEAELLRAKEAEMLRAMEAEMLRAREVDLLRAREAELLKAKAPEPKEDGEPAASKETKTQLAAETTPVTISETPEVSIEVSEETAPKEAPPARPPPPRLSPQPPMPAQFPYQEYMPYSLPPQPFYPDRNFSDDEGGLPQAPQRRRRHHRSRRESTSEEEFQRDQRKLRHGTRSPEPSIPTLGGQLIRACGNSIRETGDELMTILRASSKDENKRDLHIALIILIVIVAGLMALGMSAERDVHHHHWDYFNPPGNGRA